MNDKARLDTRILRLIEGERPPEKIEEDLWPGEAELRRDERTLKFVADRLADAVESCEQALHAAGNGEMGGRVRRLFHEMQTLQEDVARAFGHAVGERIAAQNSWRVREGIDVLEDQRR